MLPPALIAKKWKGQGSVNHVISKEKFAYGRTSSWEVPQSVRRNICFCVNYGCTDSIKPGYQEEGKGFSGILGEIFAVTFSPVAFMFFYK